ncbi:hypothetical protein ABZ682_19185 [Streptomyces griseoviridis]|uniref:hypothetical protein n=1 Tax=Streptomyces griseoviridis TaxID=45398 RepID=UPI0033D31CF1
MTERLPNSYLRQVECLVGDNQAALYSSTRQFSRLHRREALPDTYRAIASLVSDRTANT